MSSWISTRTGQFAYFDRQLGYPDWTGKRVLDFAGNVGNILLDPSCKIEPQNYWSIDVSRAAIVEGRRRHPGGNFVFYDRYNFEYNPFGQIGLPIPDQGVTFDYIVGWSIFTHISKAETFEFADQLLDMLANEGKAAFSFIDPWFTPPAGWARESESPGLSNLEWLLQHRAQLKTEMDVPALVERCRETGMTWTTLVNDDDLYFDPDDDGLSADKPNLTYLTFCTPEYMQQLFPTGQVLDPVPPERLHCLILDKRSRRGAVAPYGRSRPTAHTQRRSPTTIVSDRREADRISDNEPTPERRPLDFAPVEGSWVSTTGLVGGVARIRARRHDGSLLVGADGYRPTRPGDWGEVPAELFASTLRPGADQVLAGFIAPYESEHVHSRLESYLALGVMTGHAFHRFAEGSGRRDYFTREFYVSAAGGSEPAEPHGDGLLHPLLRTGANEPGALLGTWKPLAPSVTKSIFSLECARVDGDVVLRIHGVGADGPVDWGTARAELFADAHYLDNAPAFLADFDHGYMRVHLQGRINRGVLLICVFTTFTDGSGRSDYFARECFCR